MAQQMRLPPFMKAETMSVVTPSRSKEWRSYNVWPPLEIQQPPPRKTDENWAMVKSGVFTEGETFDETVETLYNHETRVTEIDKFLVKRRMREERCYHREIALVHREKLAKARARDLVYRKKKLYEENKARDAVVESYAKFKQIAEKEAQSLADRTHISEVPASEQIKSQKEFANMSIDLLSLLSDVAMGSGNIHYARTIHNEVKTAETIARDIAGTLSVAKQKNHHRSQLPDTLSKIHQARMKKYTLKGVWTWPGPRGSSPRRSSLENRASNIFQSLWRGYALRTADTRASSVMSTVDERSTNRAQMFSAAAMRMFEDKGKQGKMAHAFDPRASETSRHIRMLAKNKKKFEAAGRRLSSVEKNWKRRAAMSRQKSFHESRSMSIGEDSEFTEMSKIVIDESLLEEGMALAKERAVVNAAIQYTAACIIQRFARMLLVELVDYIPEIVVVSTVPKDLRRNKSRRRVEKLMNIREIKKHKKMVYGFTMFQRRARYFLTHSVAERAARDAIGRLIVRKHWRTKGAAMMEGLRAQRREFLCSAVSTTVATVRKRLEAILKAWRAWAAEQGERRVWLSGRDARRRALIIEDMLRGRLLLKRSVRAEVLRDMGGSMTRVLTKYKQSQWDWCSLLNALDEEFQKVDPNGVIASRILPINSTASTSTINQERMRKLQGMRSPLHPHVALVYLLSTSQLHRRIAVPPRKSTGQQQSQFRAITPQPTPLFPEIASASSSSLVVKKNNSSNNVEEGEILTSPSGRFSAIQISAPTWEHAVSDELMFASELNPKQVQNQSRKKRGKIKLKVGGGEEELEARRLEARADDSHVHRHLTVPLWRFLGSCGEFFKKCSANAVARDEANTIAEEREMLDAFLGMFFEVRQESLPYLELGKATMRAMKNNEGLFWRWLHECEYCPKCFTLATHPTGEGYGVVDWSNPSRPPRRRCPSCHMKFISRCRADTGAVASRLRSKAGISSQNVPSVDMVIEPVSSLFLHAALAVLAPVGSWRRSKGLSEVWGQALELAKPIIKNALAANINTVADLAARRSEIYSLTEDAGIREKSEEDLLVVKTLSFLSTLDELIIRRAADRKKADLALITDSTSVREEQARRALRTRQTTVEASRLERATVSTRVPTARSISFSKDGKDDDLHTQTRNSRKNSRESTRSLMTPLTGPPSTRLHSATSQHPRLNSDDTPPEKPKTPKKKMRQPKGMFKEADYRVRPLPGGSLYE